MIAEIRAPGNGAFEDPDKARHDAWWALMRPEDRAYMLARRNYPAPCCWCGGRLRHNPLCVTLTPGWRLEMPFGKHRGQCVAELATDYLDWLVEFCPWLSPELRDAIGHELEGRAA